MDDHTQRAFPWRVHLSELTGTALLVVVGLLLVIAMFGTVSPISQLLPDEPLRRAITGFLFGTTGALIALSPVGRRSGAHINPVVTLGFRLAGKIGRSVAFGATLPGAGFNTLAVLLGEVVTTFVMVSLLTIFLAFCPLEMALGKGIIDALYIQSGPLGQLTEARDKFKAIKDLSRYPDWTVQLCNQPTTATCTQETAEKHPEHVVTWLKAMIKVGRCSTGQKHAAAAILDKQTSYLDVEHTYRGIKDVDIVPNLSPQNLKAVEIGKNFMLSHGYIKNDFNVYKWAAPQFLEQAAKELVEQRWKKVTTEKLPETSELQASARRVG